MQGLVAGGGDVHMGGDGLAQKAGVVDHVMSRAGVHDEAVGLLGAHVQRGGRDECAGELGLGGGLARPLWRRLALVVLLVLVVAGGFEVTPLAVSLEVAALGLEVAGEAAVMACGPRQRRRGGACVQSALDRMRPLLSGDLGGEELSGLVGELVELRQLAAGPDDVDPRGVSRIFLENLRDLVDEEALVQEARCLEVAVEVGAARQEGQEALGGWLGKRVELLAHEKLGSECAPCPALGDGRPDLRHVSGLLEVRLELRVLHILAEDVLDLVGLDAGDVCVGQARVEIARLQQALDAVAPVLELVGRVAEVELEADAQLGLELVSHGARLSKTCGGLLSGLAGTNELDS